LKAFWQSTKYEKHNSFQIGLGLVIYRPFHHISTQSNRVFFLETKLTDWDITKIW